MSVHTEFSETKDKLMEHLNDALQDLLVLNNPRTSGYEEYANSFKKDLRQAQMTIHEVIYTLE